MAPPPSQQLAATLQRQRSYTRTPSTMAGGGGRSPRFPTKKPLGKKSMFVIDPKTMATRYLVAPSVGALEGTNTRLVRLFVWLKNASERWFTHVFILVALVIYAFIGGAIFNKIEGDFEEEQNAIIRDLHYPIANMSESTVEELWKLRSRFLFPPEVIPGRPIPPAPPVHWQFERNANILLDRYEATVRKQCQKRIDVGIEHFQETDEWSLMGAVFFSMTVFTTIGYGDKPPKTTAGKVAVMLYSFIGIPLLLIVLADFGKIFTKLIKLMLIYIRRLYYNRSLRGVRRATRAARIQDAITDAFAKIQRPPPFFVDPVTGRLTMWPTKPEDVEAAKAAASAAGSVQGTPVSIRRAPRMTFSPATPSSSTPDTPMPPEALITFEELDDEFDLPVTLALTILMVYLLLGAIIFWSSENWTLLHAFYFVFISMSTIGFGDFIPSRVNVLMYAFIYLLFGLALTSMCINVIQEKLSSTFEMARMTIGETIGLDPSTPITIVEPNNKSGASSEKSSKDNSRRGSKDDAKGGGGKGGNLQEKSKAPKKEQSKTATAPKPGPSSTAASNGTAAANKDNVKNGKR